MSVVHFWQWQNFWQCSISVVKSTLWKTLEINRGFNSLPKLFYGGCFGRIWRRNLNAAHNVKMCCIKQIYYLILIMSFVIDIFWGESLWRLPQNLQVWAKSCWNVKYLIKQINHLFLTPVINFFQGEQHW